MQQSFEVLETTDLTQEELDAIIQEQECLNRNLKLNTIERQVIDLLSGMQKEERTRFLIRVQIASWKLDESEGFEGK